MALNQECGGHEDEPSGGELPARDGEQVGRALPPLDQDEPDTGHEHGADRGEQTQRVDGDARTEDEQSNAGDADDRATDADERRTFTDHHRREQHDRERRHRRDGGREAPW